MVLREAAAGRDEALEVVGEARRGDVALVRLDGWPCLELVRRQVDHHDVAVGQTGDHQVTLLELHDDVHLLLHQVRRVLLEIDRVQFLDIHEFRLACNDLQVHLKDVNFLG